MRRGVVPRRIMRARDIVRIRQATSAGSHRFLHSFRASAHGTCLALAQPAD